MLRWCPCTYILVFHAQACPPASHNMDVQDELKFVNSYQVVANLRYIGGIGQVLNRLIAIIKQQYCV